MDDKIVNEINPEESLHNISQKNIFARTVDFVWSFIFGSYKRMVVSLFAFLLFFAFYSYLVPSPTHFPIESTITIEKGTTLRKIAQNLESEGVIRSQFLFRMLVILFGGEKSANAGEYFLNEKEDVFIIAHRIVNGEFGLTPITVQIPEGLNTKEIALYLSNSIDTFDMKKFLLLAKNDEGYLFPDTYYFLPNVSEEEVYKTMRENFNIHLKEISKEIKDFGRPIKDVVTMASIIELEASDLETKRNISGVLWNRIDINMPLQVDAVFVYLLKKGTSQLSLEDLKMDSPYNTYKNIGLPPGPISNPSLDSILAAVTPIKSGYLYYLADKKGKTYFSKTFIEHKRKKSIYIK